AANSLVGSTAGDAVGQRAIGVLSTGNYVVITPTWTNGTAASAGAVTLVNGTNGNIAGTASPGGAVSPANSLVGTTANDQVGSNILAVLTNGNYVVTSPNWNNGGVAGAGAVTLVNGTTGNIVGTGSPGGAVSVSNSLLGTHPNDQIGFDVRPINGTNYLVIAPNWANGTGAERSASATAQPAAWSARYLRPTAWSAARPTARASATTSARSASRKSVTATTSCAA